MLLFFSEFYPPGRVWAEFGSKIFLSLSRHIESYIITIWLKIMTESCFLIFWIFLLFFLEFSPQGRVWAEFGTKIILSPSRPIQSYIITIWLKITMESCSLIFWIFLLFVFGICSPGSSMSGIRVQNSFFCFSAYLIPFWLKIPLKICFLIF